MKNNDPRSLLERLEAHHQAGYLSLHMPGHKENTALAPYLAQLGAQWDITELPGFDDLHDPQDILAQAMDRAAKLWGSRKSWLQVNGSTGGLLAAIRAATRRGDQVLVARHCHKAIYHAIEVCGLEPIFLLPPVVEGLGIAGSLTPAQVAQALEELDPSEHYRGTPLEGLDAFQRQLKRFDIHVKGAGSDMVEKFFHTTDSAVLFPEFVSRVVRQGMESDILPEITATTTNFDGMDYRTIASVPTDDDKALRRVEEGAVLPTTAIRTQENLVKLHKRGRMLVASYEAIRFQRLDLFSVTLRQIGAYIARMHLDDAVQVLMNGDGNNNAADAYEIGSGSGKISGTAGTLTYSALLEFWSKFDPYSMNTMLVSNDVMLQMLKLSEFQNPLTGLNFQGTGTLSTPLGAKLLRTSAVPAGKLIGLDKNYALEHICGSEVMVEYDKLIDRQIERAAITSISGFAKPYQEASKVLTV